VVQGIRRGLPQSCWDLETAAPGPASGPWLGYQCRSLLAPVGLVAEPWPSSTRWGLGLVVAGLLFAATARRVRGSRTAQLPATATLHA
jgi:short subunit fatty acids transporter